MTEIATHSWPPAPYKYLDNDLYCEQVALKHLTEHYGTPLYVYSTGHIRAQIQALREAFSAFSPLLCYAVKANDNHAILDLCRKEGTGFDIVSSGELQRVLRAGADPATIVFSGVGKTNQELEAAIQQSLRSINIESEDEADRLIAIAERMGKTAPVSVRVNPDVDARTHPKIATGLATSKFGVDFTRAMPLVRKLHRHDAIALQGLACHIGSQLLDPEPILAALDRILSLAETLDAEGIPTHHLDLGGGFGIPYQATDHPLDIRTLGQRIAGKLSGFAGTVAMEPGRYIVGNAGVLCTNVIQEKTNTAGTRLVIVDAAMNDLMRPALYDAHHEVLAVSQAAGLDSPADVVGPICESSDVLATNTMLPPLHHGDALALLSAGAYGSVMAGTYNSRLRPAEVLVNGDQYALMRPRETMTEMLARDAVAFTWEKRSP